MIKLSIEKAFLNEDIKNYYEKASNCHKMLLNKDGKGSDYTGWVEWPSNYCKKEFERIVDVANGIRANCDVFLVCGIGGSYLGARAAIEMINGLYSNKKPEIIYVGNNFSSTYISQILEYIKGKSVSMNIISKSGSTTETQIALRIFRKYIIDTYGEEESRKRIIVTTDANKGFVRKMAMEHNYPTFSFPEDIGGRYSVLTAVGLLPIAVAGIDIYAMLEGAKLAQRDFGNDSNPENNDALKYAITRRILENQGYHVEMLVTYEVQMLFLAEWWKQLFAESEGKENQGILPISANFSADLHSLGQYLQQGRDLVFETCLRVKKPSLDYQMNDESDFEELKYLNNKSVHYVNEMAAVGTLQAHADDGNVPNIIVEIEDMSAKTFGYLVYFFFISCAVSVYMLDLNPFDQPGVEGYKKHMYKLLGKYEISL